MVTKIQTSDAGSFRPARRILSAAGTGDLRQQTHRSPGDDFRLHRSVSCDRAHVLGHGSAAAHSSGPRSKRLACLTIRPRRLPGRIARGPSDQNQASTLAFRGGEMQACRPSSASGTRQMTGRVGISPQKKYDIPRLPVTQRIGPTLVPNRSRVLHAHSVRPRHIARRM